MSFLYTPRSLQAVAAHLPFAVDDIEQANASFVRWRASGEDADKRIVDLWTYCYVRRYFLVKFARDGSFPEADLDALVEKAFKNVERGQPGIRQPDRYAHWVSKLCKNAFRNYLRVRRIHVPFDEHAGPALVAEPREVYNDLGVVVQVVLAAIDRLPPFLQEVARLYLVERCPYEEIEQRLGKPIPVLRAYVHKALRRLRQDPTLRDLQDPAGDVRTGSPAGEPAGQSVEDVDTHR